MYIYFTERHYYMFAFKKATLVVYTHSNSFQELVHSDQDQKHKNDLGITY